MTESDTNHPPPPTTPRDRLTIRRLLAITAGVAVGLSVFGPQTKDLDYQSADWWIIVWNALVIGLSLPVPLFAIGARPRHGVVMGPGGIFALMAGLGALTMLPPVLMARRAARLTLADGVMALFCLSYVLPLMGIWYVLAVLVSGQVRVMFRADTPWLDRYGGFLATLWSPLGLWHLIRFYQDAF